MTTSNRRRHFSLLCAARGFTLIEFMIVFAIMGVVIAFVGPRVAGGLMGLNTRKAALQTAAMLRYAHSKAVNTGCRYHVIFDGVDRRVILLQAAREDNAGPPPLDINPDDGQGVMFTESRLPVDITAYEKRFFTVFQTSEIHIPPIVFDFTNK